MFRLPYIVWISDFNVMLQNHVSSVLHCLDFYHVVGVLLCTRGARAWSLSSLQKILMFQ
jgi:hypothetical protein